jgi:hypothetical protein
LARPTAAAAQPSATKQNVKFVIAIPSAPVSGSAVLRRPRYISINTNSVAIAVNGAVPVVLNVGPNSPYCTGGNGARTCSVTVSAPPGQDTFTENMYASTNGTGAALSTSTTSAAIVAGQANVVNVVLDGVVATIALSLAKTAPPEGSPISIPLTVNFNDASGAAIIGSDPFANPITLTDSDTSGATSISKTALNSPADAVNLTVNYTGAPIAQAVFGATAAGVPAGSVTPATLTPINGTAFVDWPTYAYDSARDGYNPYSTAITPTSIVHVKQAWYHSTAGDSQSQPVVATNIAGHAALVIVGNFNGMAAFDGTTGAPVWQDTLGTQNLQGCGTAPIAGTPFYDRALGSLFIAGGDSGNPSHVIMYQVNVATGQLQAKVDVTPTLLPGEAVFGHTAITYANGNLYVGTGSNCEGTTAPGLPSWRGRVVAVNASTMQLGNTFFTTWGQGGNYGGGGVWGFGGVSADPAGNIYTSGGNAETPDSVKQTPPPPFVLAPTEYTGYAEHLVKLSPDVSTVEDSNYPGFNFNIGGSDLDFTGSPIVYQPQGCGEQTATMGKGGTLTINSTSQLSPALANLAINVPSGRENAIGSASFSPVTDLLYASVATSGQGSLMLSPGLIAVKGCGANTEILWNTAFGPDSQSLNGENPRSAPTVTAGGVILVGVPQTSGGTIYAVDAASGNLLNGANPIFSTGDIDLMPPTVSGQWIYLLDNSGNLYGLTVDPAVQAMPASHGRRVTPKFHIPTDK